jgi:hypothetical protein
VFERKRYPNFRNVISKREPGRLSFEISPVGNYGSYVFGLLLVSIVFLWGCSILAAAAFPLHTNAGFVTFAASCLLPIAFLLLWFFVAVRLILKRLSSIEISLDHGVLQWKQRTFGLIKQVSVPEENVTEVAADRRWYRNALKLKMNGKAYVLDDLLSEDLECLSRQLRTRLGRAN